MAVIAGNVIGHLGLEGEELVGGKVRVGTEGPVPVEAGLDALPRRVLFLAADCVCVCVRERERERELQA